METTELIKKYAEHIADSGRANIIDEIKYLIGEMKSESKKDLEGMIQEIVN